MCGAGAHEARAGRVRARHIHQLVGDRADQAAAGADAGARGAGRAGATRRRVGWRARRGVRRPRRGGSAREAEKLVYAEFARELLALNAKYGLNLSGAPKLNDPDFVYQLVFDPARGSREPKARFAYLFPSASSALVSVRLKAGLSDEQRADAVELVRAAVRMPEWQLEGGGRTPSRACRCWRAT